ncbi:MAG: response regulator [Candidatus Omnitrophica bacterium]|nr:response regulator [Candidatus Omnitrophota bacterium]
MPKKILLIDDNEELCDELANLFREEGLLVDNASDSAKGAVLIENNRYDGGIFDYKMKGLTGIDLLKRIKSVNPQCVVFIISGLASIETILQQENVMDLVAGIIKKPFEIEMLIQMMLAIC